MARTIPQPFEEWLLTHPPMMGGAPDEGEGEGSGEGSGEGEGSGTGTAAAAASEGSGEGQGEGSGADEATAALRAENQRLKREAAAREKDRRKAEADAKKAEDDRKAEQGEWKKLAEERSEKIAELEAAIADRDRKDAERGQRTLVETVADRLNFKRPKRAYAILIDELGTDKAAETLADEQLTEAALKRIARSEPELVDTTRRTGAPVNGRGGGNGSDPARELNSTLATLLGTPVQ